MSLQNSVYDTYLARYKCNFNLSFTLGFNDALVGLYDIVPRCSSLDFVDDIPKW